MRPEFVIDGYNLMMKLPETRPRSGPGNLERARDRLVAWLARRLPDRARATIVFDAKSLAGDRSGARRSKGAIVIQYASGYPSADAWIIEHCEHHRDPRSLTVVSDDNEVRLMAKHRKASVKRCAEFEHWLEKNGREPSSAAGGRTVEPPPKARPAGSNVPQASSDSEKPAGPSAAEIAEFTAIFGDGQATPKVSQPVSPAPTDRKRRKRGNRT